jgi:hypothetical protein
VNARQRFGVPGGRAGLDQGNPRVGGFYNLAQIG